MRAFVFTDPALTSRAGQFVWLELNIDDDRNAALAEKIGVEFLPTHLVLKPDHETVALRRAGALTVAEMVAFLDAARAALGDETPSSPADAALVRAERLNGEGKKAEAVAAYREALAAAPPAWRDYGRTATAFLFLQQTEGGGAECVALAREARSRLAGTPDAATVAVSGLDCALALEKADPARPAAIAEMEVAVRRLLGDAETSVDAAWPAYDILIRARRDADDDAGAKKDAEACASLLEARAAEAKTPEGRAVFDASRLSVYVELQQPERAIPMLRESERDLPDDYNPPARLAEAYLELKRLDEALAASSRALAKVSGLGRVPVLERRADILAARGDTAAAREALEQALSLVESLPPGWRRDFQSKHLKEKLEALSRSAASPGTA
jgi:tetratricopeptide (TPR) repeat protein